MNNQAENPYVGTRTFSEEDAPRYFGRERESRDLLALVAFEQVVLFYAQSGTGKSSLVNTRLIPGLETDGRFEVLTPSRVTGEIPPKAAIENLYVYSLMQNLAGHTLQPETIGGMRIKDFLPNLIRDTGSEKRSFIFAPGGGETQKPKRRVLIIDQFEELFTTHPEEWESRADFFEQLAEALEEDPNLWVVLVMREDNIAYLDPYAHLMPGGLRVRYYMQKMDFEDALKAVKNPAENAGRPFNEGVAEQLVNDLRGRQFRKREGKTQPVRGQYVEPIVLQAVCSTLWQELDTEGRAITTSDLKKLGNVNKALGKYYEKRVHEVAGMDEVKNLGIRESEIRNWIGSQLITAEGRRNIVVRKAGGRSGGLEDSVVQLFSKKKDLIWEEGHGAASIYELTHDRLAKPILENNREWEKENGFPFHSQVILWSEAKGKGKEVHLLSEQALAEAEKWIAQNPDQLSNLESEFLDACRSKKQEEEDRRAGELQQQERERAIQQERLDEQTRSAQQARRLTRIAFAFLALAIMALVVAGWQWRDANNKNDQLNESQILLQEQTDRQKSLVDDFTATKLSGRVFEVNLEFDQSLLLSVQAYKFSNKNTQAQAALVQNFQKLQHLQRIFSPPETSVPPENSDGNLQISPDGGFVAVWGNTEITIWNQSTGISESFPITEIQMLYFTPDNKLLVAVDRSGIRRWSLGETAIRALPGGSINFHPGSTTRLYAGDGASFFVSQGEDGSIFSWDARTNISEKMDILNEDQVIFGPSGESLAGMDENGNITLQSIKDKGKVLGRFQGGTPTFSPDGSRLAVVNIDQSVAVRQVADEVVSFDIVPQLNGDISSMVFSKTGSYLAVSDGSETEIWDLDNQRKLGISIDGFPLTFSPDENLFVVGQFDEITYIVENRIYCLPENRAMETPPEENFVGFSHDGKTVVTVDSSDEYFFHSVLENCALSQVTSPAFQAESILLSPAARVLASLEMDGSVLLRNVTDGAPLRDDPIYQPKIQESPDSENRSDFDGLRFSPGGGILVYVINNELHLWDMNNNWEEIPLGDEDFLSDPITALEVSDNLLLMGRKSGTITKWELPGGNRLDLDDNARSKIDRVVFNQENNNQALSISENSIFLVDLISGEKRTEAMTGTFLDVSWKSGLLATAPNADEIEIRDLNTGAVLNDEDPIEGIAIRFTPDGTHFLLTDGSSWALYDAKTFEPTGNALVEDSEDPGPHPEISALIQDESGYEFLWRKDGKRFALASPENYVQIYEVDTGNVDSPINFLGYSRYGYGGFMAFSEESDYFYFNEGGCWIDVLNLRANPAGWSTDKCTSGSFPIYLDETKFIVGVNNSEESEFPPTRVMIYDMLSYGPGDTPKQLSSSRVDLDGRVGMRSYSLSKGGARLVTLGVDGVLYLWDLENAPRVIGGVFGDAENPVSSAAISPDGAKQVLFIGKGMKISDTAAAALPEETFNDHALGINQVVFNREGSIFAALGDRETTIFYTSAGVREGELVDGVFERADGEGFFWKTTLGDETSTLWNSATGKKVTDLSKGDQIYASLDGNYVAIKNTDNSIWFLDANKDPSDNKIGNNIVEGENITFNNFDGAVFVAVLPVTDEEEGSDTNHLWKISSDANALEPVDIAGNFLSFTTTGRYVAMREADGKIRIWDLATGTSVDDFSGSFFGFSPQADLLAYQDGNQIILKNITGNDIVGRADGHRGVFSPDGSILIIYNESADRSTLLSANTGMSIGRFNGEIDIIEAGDENMPYIYTSSEDDGYHLLGLAEGGDVNQEPIFADDIFRSPNGKYLITISFSESGETINLLDGLTGQPLGEGVDLSGWENFSEDGNLLIIRHPDQRITLLDAANPGETVAEIDADRVLLMEKHDYAIAINADNGGVSVWDINGHEKIGEIIDSIDANSISGAVISPDTKRKTLALFGSQGTVLWDIDKNETIGDVLREQAGTVMKMSFSPNNRFLASLGRDGIIVWNISRKPPTNERLIPGTMLDMSFNAAEDHITYLSQDYEIYEVNIQSGAGMDEPLASPILNPARVCRYDLSDDGTRAAFLVSNRVIVWDRSIVEPGIPEPIAQKINSGCDKSAIVFSPDGSTLAILDGSQIHLWDAETNELSGRIKLSEGTVFPAHPAVPIAFIDNQTIAVESYVSPSDESSEEPLVVDQGFTISLWDLESKSKGLTIEGGMNGLTSNGSILLYRDQEERVILQDQDSAVLTRFDNMRDGICNIVGRNFTRAEWAEFLLNEPPYPDSAENATCPQWEIEPAPVTGN